MRGLVLKGIGGFYFVETSSGIYRAKARGVFKKNNDILFVGDEVELEISDNKEDDAWICDILPRRNFFLRPPISNVDKLIVVFAATNPEPNFTVIDKLLMAAEKKGIEPAICINKADLVDVDKLKTTERIYENVYPTYVTNAKTGEGIENLKNIIGEGRVAFAGPSGVGKSTIVNYIVPGGGMATRDISSKTLRGKHTTRHVEILHCEHGYVFDTPGFTSLDLPREITVKGVGTLYPEMRKASGNCKFGDCMHINELECGVRAAVATGDISAQRYKTYLGIVKELKEKRKKYE